jgi:urease accessory protein
LSLTKITVEGDRVGLRHGQLRAQRVGDRDGWLRIGLLATTALLLGGDEVELNVAVGAGTRLDLFDIAGTVAYHGRGRAAAWHVRIELTAQNCAIAASRSWCPTEPMCSVRSVRTLRRQPDSGSGRR